MNTEKLILIGLLQAILYTVLWLYNDYVALILCLAFALISFAILVISWIADRIEYARVGSWYYPLLIISFFIPLLVTGLFWFFKGGEMSWMKPIF